MKKILFLMLVTLIALASCRKQEKSYRNADGTINIYVKNESISVKGGEEMENTEKERHLTPAEIVVKLKYMNSSWYEEDGEHSFPIGFSETQRDYVNHILKMWDDDILIRIKGKLELNDDPGSFVNRHNVHGIDSSGRVICYIPNKQLRETAKKVRELYKEGKIEEIYKVFQEGYTAIPITTEEYEELRRKGEQ